MTTRLLLALLLVLVPRLVLGACTGTDTYSVMICNVSGEAHYWRMNQTSSANPETDFNGTGYSAGDLNYINTADVTVLSTGLVPGNTDKAVTFGGAAVNPGFAIENVSGSEFSPHRSSGGANDKWTLEFWMKPSSLSGTRNIFSVADSSQYNWRLYSTSSGGAKMRFLIFNNSGTCGGGGTVLDLLATNAFSTSTPYYVVVEVDAGSTTWNAANFYINNVLDATAVPSGSECGTDHRFYAAIEGQDRNNAFAGVLDDVVIYNHILSTAERTDHYNGFPTNTLGVKRLIEAKRREGVPRARRVLDEPEPFYLDETGPIISRLNDRLMTARSQYEGRTLWASN